MTDIVRVVEAAYDLDTKDDHAWLTKVAEIARAELEFDDGIVAYTFDVRDDGWITPHTICISGTTPDVAAELLNPGAFPAEETSAIVRRHMTSGVGLATDLITLVGNPSVVGREYFQRVLGARGYADALTLNATDPTRNGCLFFVPVKRKPKLVARLRNRYEKLSAHLAAGLRLRRAIGALQEEAVIESNGKVAHATGDATEATARDALRDAVRSIDRARGKLRKRDPEEALETWRGLVAGRWSLVDRFESDGRRFIVAHPNPPDAPDPRALSARERQVAGFVALGQSNKLIAYELGISPSTVGVLAARAARKLGLASRDALAAAFMPRPPSP